MKKLSYFTIVFFLINLISKAALACSYAPLTPGQENKIPAKIIVSSNGNFILKLIPPFYMRDKQGELFERRKGYGEAFKTMPDGKLESMWKITIAQSQLTDFAGTFFLADDGIHLVQIKQATSLDDKKSMTIYNRGKIFRSYAPLIFMPQLNRLEFDSCGNASWIKENLFKFNQASVVLENNIITFQTIDDKKWRFELTKPPAIDMMPL